MAMTPQDKAMKKILDKKMGYSKASSAGAAKKQNEAKLARNKAKKK